MTKIDTYDILYDKSIKMLKSRVEDKKMRGFRCVGGIEIHDRFETSADGEKNITTIFYQAMELKEPQI